MLMPLAEIEPLLRSPTSGARLRRFGSGYVSDDDPDEKFPIVGDAPVLIDFADSVFAREELVEAKAASKVPRPRFDGWRRALKRLISPPKSITSENVAILTKLLLEIDPKPIVLVLGGGTVGQGMQPLYDHPAIQIIALDVYASCVGQLIADAHHIPLGDSVVHGVIAQAVLEHVLVPEQVVAEMWRVLRPDGLAYVETPFMQQVHEGPYDFLRFTANGHRWLLRRFDDVRLGVCGGPGTQLLWSIDYFARAAFRSAKIGKVFKLGFFWLAFADRIIPADHASDAASGTYFLGRKSDRQLQPHEIVACYKGAQQSAREALPA